MKQQRIEETSGYKGMWLFALFDLPTETKDDKRQYVRFRNGLLKLGFLMLQYSVYARYYQSEEACKTHRKRVKSSLPPRGYVRLLAVTDKQYEKMECFIGKKRHDTEEPPPQMMLF